MKTRRDFIAGVAAMAGASVATGCKSTWTSVGGATGVPMRNFRCAPMKRIRLGLVGCGYRGIVSVPRLVQLPGVEITAVCDIREPLARKAAATVPQRPASRSRKGSLKGSGMGFDGG